MSDPLAPARLLVVDDNPDVAGIVRLAVRRMNRRVEVASEINPERALERLRSEPFDLVLGDFRMREMDGLQFLKLARETRPEGLRMLFTAYAGHLDKEKLADAQVDGVLEKPMMLGTLGEMLDAVLDHDPSTLAALKRAMESRTAAR